MGAEPDQVSSFTELQVITDEWRQRALPPEGWTLQRQFEGMVEELGELSHAKRNAASGIRGHEEHTRKEMDAIGDWIIYAAGYCSRRGFSLHECITMAWEECRTRDWIRYPETGRPPERVEEGAHKGGDGGPEGQQRVPGVGGLRFDERSLD